MEVEADLLELEIQGAPGAVAAGQRRGDEESTAVEHEGGVGGAVQGGFVWLQLGS
jgi:hypothetical protein